MTLKERIDDDFKREFKAGNAAAVSTLRLLKAALKNAEIDKMKPLEESEVSGVIVKEVKKLRDGLDSFIAGKRDDLAESAKKEIALLEAYLPKQMGDGELKALIEKTVAALGQVTQKDFGKVMSTVMKESGGAADGSRVSALVKEVLAGK